MSRIGSNRRGAHGVRGDTFPRIHFIADSRRDPEHWWLKYRVNLSNVQRHCVGEKGNEELCAASSKIFTEYARRFAHRQWSFLGPGSEKKWYGTPTYKPNGKWDRVAEDMMNNFSESGHPVFGALERGSFAKQSNKKKCLCISVVTTTQPKLGSSHNHYRQSAQYLRSSSGHMRRIGLQNLWLLGSTGKLIAHNTSETWWCQQNCRQRTKRLGPMRLCKETCCTIMNENSQIFQIMFNW